MMTTHLHQYETLSSRGQDNIRSHLLDSLGVQMERCSSQESLHRAMLYRSKIPSRFQSKHYKWEQGFSSRRRNSVLSNAELTRLSLNDMKNYKWCEQK
mmetsp:Transcript_4933/g.10929  ORF Transcript_4933/g.10929 Transcript_4933/m.10929 type:complete len:98 (+) Transcript_4933:173-466(+)